MLGSWMYNQGFSSQSTYVTVMASLLLFFMLLLALMAAVIMTRQILRASESDEVLFERENIHNPEYFEDKEDLSEEEMVSGIIQGYLALEPELRQHITEVGISSNNWHNEDIARCAGMIFRPGAEQWNRFSDLKVDISQHTISQLCPGAQSDPVVFANALSGVVYDSCQETRERAAIVGLGASPNNLGSLAGGVTGIS